MKIKSIHLKNFRQFIDETIEFSTDNDRNITLVKGHNSGGKTTLANAISWCLFGTYKFKDEVTDAKGSVRLVNNLIWQNSKPNTIIPVTVVLEVIHADITYKIETTLKYKTIIGISADSRLRVQPEGYIEREVSFKDENYEPHFLKGIDAENKIAEIFPEGLSDYIILRAEELDVMVQNLGKKDTSMFKEAVNKILGLDISEKMRELILKTQQQITTSYRNSVNDAKIQNLQNSIENIKEECNKLRDEIAEQQSLMNIAKDTMEKETEIINQGETGRILQTKIENAKAKCIDYKNKIEVNNRKMYISFSKNIVKHLYKALLPELNKWLDNAKEDLDSEQKISNMYIDGLTKETIEAILNSGICVCGNPIIEGSKEWKLLEERKKYVPPEALGILIKQFKGSVIEKQESIENSIETTLPKIYQDFCNEDAECDNNIKVIEKDIKDWEKDLEGQPSIQGNLIRKAKAQQDYDTAKRNRDCRQEKLNTKIKEQKELENSLKIEEEKLSGNIILKNKKNLIDKVASMCLKINLDNKEKLKELLNKCVNEFFTETFSDDYKIEIDPNYSIQLYTRDGEPIGAGGAQNVSTILAFISSLLKLAQQIHYNELQGLEFNILTAEPYPLVLDAPFSTFDKERTSIVSSKLSGLTEQIIIFSKDPECQLIIDNASNKIGKFYNLKFEIREEDGKAQVWRSNIIEGEE